MFIAPLELEGGPCWVPCIKWGELMICCCGKLAIGPGALLIDRLLEVFAGLIVIGKPFWGWDAIIGPCLIKGSPWKDGKGAVWVLNWGAGLFVDLGRYELLNAGANECWLATGNLPVWTFDTLTGSVEAIWGMIVWEPYLPKTPVPEE